MSTETKFNWIRTSYLLKDGTWLHDTKETPLNLFNIDYAAHLESLWSEQHSYIYITNSGTTQSCTATIMREQREWITDEGDRQFHDDIAVSFSEELGSEAGSWKGGVVGVTWTMLPNETPLEALRRMELNRTF